jgi:AAA domain
MLDKFMVLLIGKPGSGKTLSGVSFHESGPMEFIDFDGRMKPVKLYYPKARIHYSKFDVSNLEKFAYNYIPDLVKDCPYKNVQLAGITALSTVAISYQMFQRRAGNDPLKKTRGGLMVPSWDEFNGEAMIIGQVLDALKALPCNVFVEAHPVTRTDITKAEKYTSLVAFGPKVESLIPGYFDEIWYFTSEFGIQGDLKYVVYTKPSNEYPLAKTSLPLPGKFVLSDDEGRPISLYRLIKKELEKYDIRMEEEEQRLKEIGENV